MSVDDVPESAGAIDDLRERVLDAARSWFEAQDGPFEAPSASFLREEFFTFEWPDWRLVDDYWVREPFAHVAILMDPDSGEKRYHVTEPSLDEFESHVRDDLTDRLRTRLLDAELDPEIDESRFLDALDRVIEEDAATVPPGTRWKLRYYLRRNFRGYGAVDPFMRDPDIEDISCNGADVPVYVYHAEYGNVETNRSWGADRLDSLAITTAQRAGRHVSASRPLVTATLPDGSRVQVTLGSDVAARGSNFTVRKFREEPFTPTELIGYGTFSIDQMAYLWLAIEHNRSVLYVGPTASGKTTTMNATTLFIPPDAKVVSIEETREVNLPHQNWIADVTRESDLGEERPEIGMYDLLSEALHQRPTHVIVGEIRTDPDVVRTFFQAVGTGHAGFTTFHARTPEDVLRRLRHDPLSVPDELVTDIDVICAQRMTEVNGEKLRRNRSLTEVRPGDDGPRLKEVFHFDPDVDQFEQVGASELLREIADDEGWNDDRLREELRRRRVLLEWMVEREEFGYEAVTARLFRFARSPEEVLTEIDIEPETTPIRWASE